MLKKFQKDPIMAGLLQKLKLQEYYGGQKNHFLDLLEIVVSQQLSTKVADVIYARFLTLFPTKTPSPDEVLGVSVDQIRSVGFSRSKAAYVQNIASAVFSGALAIDHITDLSDDGVKKELIKIKGIGPWSAEMFLMFSLKRPDIFSIGDLGLRTAIEKLYGISRDDKKAILALAETWRPHRTLASRLLWASLDFH